MRKTIRKWFWMWDFDKEEQWLNEMAAKGLALVGVGFCRYDFEESTPGEYNVRLEMLKNTIIHPESQNYIGFLEDTGAEHIGTLLRWVYFRKKAEGGSFDLFSDIDSRIKHLDRMMIFPIIAFFANFINAINMTRQYSLGIYGTLFPALITWAISILLAYGFGCLLIKRHQLKKKRLLHE